MYLFTLGKNIKPKYNAIPFPTIGISSIKFNQSCLQKVGPHEELMEFIARVEDLKKWFKGYKVGTIELYIEGAVNEGNVTKLFLSFEGKGGYKVILKPVED